MCIACPRAQKPDVKCVWVGCGVMGRGIWDDYPKVLKALIKEQDLYSTPALNDKVYLHYRGFQKIEGLEAWTGLRAIWLEGNGFSKIEGLDTLSELRCLYAHQNCLKLM